MMPLLPSWLRRSGNAAVLAMLALLAVSCETTEPKKKRPLPPPPPGSELSSQPWSRPEKDWEGGKPAFMPTSN